MLKRHYKNLIQLESPHARGSSKVLTFGT